MRFGKSVRCTRRRLSRLPHGFRGELHSLEPPPVPCRAPRRPRAGMGTEDRPKPGRIFRAVPGVSARESLVSPRATARLVVTMPPEPSRLAAALASDIAADHLALTPTTDAFQHLATLARRRFT